jgi:luciferase-like monooxygenase
MRRVKLGYQFDFRNPPGSSWSFAELYSQMFRQAARAEELGFDSLWLTEHHFTDDGYLPSMIPMAAALAARTSRLTIGTYVLLAPFHHPVKLAEDAAVTDVISNGRLRLGLGLGYRPEEFEGFGVHATSVWVGRSRQSISCAAHGPASGSTMRAGISIFAACASSPAQSVSPIRRSSGAPPRPMRSAAPRDSTLASHASAGGAK